MLFCGQFNSAVAYFGRDTFVAIVVTLKAKNSLLDKNNKSYINTLILADYNWFIAYYSIYRQIIVIYIKVISRPGEFALYFVRIIECIIQNGV